jgi:hypothetical protein
MWPPDDEVTTAGKGWRGTRPPQFVRVPTIDPARHERAAPGSAT